jgi:hypothetical protein
MTTVPYSISILTGKAAVFVRGLLNHIEIESKTDLPLRPAQKAGMDAVEELGETISIPYISKLTKVLETADVITKHRKGKGYVLNKDLNFEDTITFLTESDFGMTVEKEASEDDIRMRSAIIDHMNDVGHVRIEAEHPVDKRAYQVLIDKFKAGKYDMVFVDRDIQLVEPNEHPDEHPRVFPVKTLHASVANR